MMRSPVARFECLSCGYAEYRMSAMLVGELLERECPKCRGDMAVTSREVPPRLNEVGTCVEGRFDVHDFVAGEEYAEFEVSTRNVKTSFQRLSGELRGKGYIAAIRRHKGWLRLTVARRPRLKPERAWINALLFAATVGTTLFVGYLYSGSLLAASMFSGSILLILSVHEMGHKLAASRHGVRASYPYFTPLPFGLGTFGAVIMIREPIPTREALVEMGASGPLLGFLVALPLVALGLTIPGPHLVLPGELAAVPLSFYLLQFPLTGNFSVPLTFNPLAFAGLVGMMVTWFNTLPAGFLDGGHAARGLLSREKHYSLGRTLALVLMIAGIFFPALFLWALMIFLVFGAAPHPGALDDVSELSRGRKRLAFLTFALLILCLPIPVIL